MQKREMRKYIAGILFVVLLLGSILEVSASENMPENNELKTVRVGYLIYEGYQEGEGDEPKSGYGYEYLQQIAYYAGWKYEYVNGSFSELMQMLENGEIDLMGNISYTEERARKINYADEEQGKEYYYLFVREDLRDISATDPATLNGARIGINKGSVQAELFEDWCRENDVECEVILYENSAKRYEDMNQGKLEGTISTNVAGKDIVKFRWKSILKIGSSPYYFTTSKNRPDILEELNDANVKIQQSDWYYNEKVYLKYYGKTSASAAGLSSAELEWVESQESVRIGYMDHMLPYSYRDEKTGELLGLLPAFLKQIKERYGIELETVEFSSYDQMKEALFADEIDTMFPAYGSYWAAEENNMMVTDALTNSYVLMIDTGTYPGEIPSVIAITDESPTQQFYVNEHYAQSEVLRCDSMAECIRAVIEGKASCTLMSSDVYYANRNEYDSLGDFLISNTGYETSIAFATRKDDIDMYTFMKKCVSSMTEGEVSEAMIAGRHVRTEMSVEQFLQKHVMIVIGVAAVLIILLLAFFLYYIHSSWKALALARRNYELSEKVYIDLATGLPNKNKCEEMLSSPLAVTSPTAVFMLDLNDLKVVNDTLGHEMGDLMILNFSRMLRQTVPPGYFVGRFGGDEFIIIAEGIGKREEIEALVRNIQEMVLKFNGASGEFQLSYACGYAFSEDYASVSRMELLHKADQKMYENKLRIKTARGRKTESV